MRGPECWPGGGVAACAGDHQLGDAFLQRLLLLHILLLGFGLFPLQLLLPLMDPHPYGDRQQHADKDSEEQST